MSSDANTAPVIVGKPLPVAAANRLYRFQPSATDADGDVLTFRINERPAWASFSAATGLLQGTPTSADVGTYRNIMITVTDGAALTSLEPFAIKVDPWANGAARLTWSPPTRNTDGSPLTDLAGYKIYWGTEPGVYSGSLRIDDPGASAYVVENLVPANYYFVATALNVRGVESAPSNEALGRAM